jgi:acyl-CoA thioesterase I
MKRRALIAACALAACSRKQPPATALPAGSSVLALADSVAAYPAQLAALTGWSVVNAGVPGDTAAQAAERLPALLVEHKPALVIVSAGGNDFLRRVPTAETEAALRGAIGQARKAGAQVLLVAVPQPSINVAIGAGLSDHPLYAKLADELKLPLHATGWAQVLGDEKLRSDQIHANAAGYRAFAEGLAATLRSTGLLKN